MSLHIATVPQLAKDNPALTEGGLRWDIFNAEKNGLAASKAIIRKGRRVYIVVDRYFEWLDSLGSKSEITQGPFNGKGA
jgi:hypothetical protein